MDGSEFLGDLEGSQGSLLSCSPSATSLDIDGWFSYLAAQEGARPQRPVLLQREDDPAEVLEVRTLAPAELGSQEAKHDVFAEDAFLMDHFEDWHAQDLEKILARGTTVQGELPVAVIDLHQEVEEPPEETKPIARTLEQMAMAGDSAEAEAIREMMDEVRHKQEAAPRGDTHATGAGGSVVDDNNYDDVDMDFVKEEEDVSVDIDIDVDVDIEEDHDERVDGVDGVDSADKASTATKDERRQSLTGRRRWRRSLDGSSFSSPFSSPQPTSPTTSSTAGAAASTSSPLSPSASSPNRLVVKMRRVGQGLRVSGPAAADEPSAASLGPAAEKEPAATTTTPTTSRSTGGKKQPTSTSGGKGLVSPAKRKDGVLKKIQGYTLFCQEVRERIVSANEGLPFRELQKKYGEAWRALDKAEKEAYAAQADELNREAEAAAAAEEAALRAAAEEERRRRGLERKEQLVLEKRRQEEEQERKILEKTTGKMVIPRLYLGSKHVAANEAWMEQANCTHVLNVSAEVRNFFEKRGDVAYHRIRVSDDGTQKIDKFFEEGTDFIHRVIGSFVARKYVDKANLAAITPAAGVTALAPADTSAAESAGAPEPMVVESTAETETATKTDIPGPKSEETVSGSGEERTDAMKIENEKNENEESAEKAGEAKVQEAAVAKTEENGEGQGAEAREDDEDGVNGPSVLVHCSEGRSRSPTLLIAYLMRYAKWSLKRAYEHLANLSSNLNINDGFKQQLMNYERTIHSLKVPSIDFFERTLRTVRRAVSLGGKSGQALSALNPPSTTSLAFTSPMVSRKRPPSRSAAAGAAAAAAAPTTLDDVPSFIATSPSSSLTTKLRRQSTGSSHHTPAARSSPSASARLPSFTPPIPVKRKRIINRKICDEELTVQKKIDSYFASPAPSTPLFASPTHPSSKRKASAAAQAKRRREQLGGSTSDETDADHSGGGGGKAADARNHDDDDDEDEEKENRKVMNNKRGRSSSLEGTKAAGGKRPKRRRDEDQDDDDDDDDDESESDNESEEEESEDDDGDDDELEYGKKKKKQSKPKKRPAGKKVRGKKGATTPKKAKKAKAASTPKTKTATGTKDADRVQEVVSPDLGSITILYPFDEETVKSWSSARLSAWKLRHENANAYYYRFEDPVVKQSHRASTTEQKQENHEAFMARYDEFVREGWIIGTAWGLFSKAVPGFVGYQCANYYRKLVKDGNLEDRSYTTDEKGDLKKVQRASSKGENETLNNQLNDVWRTPEVKWIESCVSKWVTKYHAKGAEKSKGTPRKMKKGGKNDD